MTLTATTISHEHLPNRLIPAIRFDLTNLDQLANAIGDASLPNHVSALHTSLDGGVHAQAMGMVGVYSLLPWN